VDNVTLGGCPMTLLPTTTLMATATVRPSTFHKLKVGGWSTS
jgi:hypothetical protein